MRQIPIIFALVASTLTVHAQEYYPLSTTNKWFYGVSNSYYPPDIGTPSLETTFVRVLADTFMVNAHRFYTLSQGDVAASRYVRTDSDGVYYYDLDSHQEKLVFRTKGAVGDTNYVFWKSFWRVVLSKIETLSVFGINSRVLNYTLEGVTIRTARFSDIFGPIGAGIYADPPPPYPNTEYRLIGCSIGGQAYGYTTGVHFEPPLHRGVLLEQNYPNPFNSTTLIRITVARPTPFSMVISNFLGQQVWSNSGVAEMPLSHVVSWTASDARGRPLPSGVYYLLLRTSHESYSMKLVLIR